MKPYNEQEFNQLCVDFIELKCHEPSGYWTLPTFMDGDGWTMNDMKFHSDWNWIMEVFKKIQEEGYMYGIVVGASSIWKYEDVTTPIFIQSSEDPLEASVRVLNQFLNWYNEQKQ
jgi:hypothetical protein